MKKLLIKAIAAAVSLTAVSGNCVAMRPLRNKQNEIARQRTAAALANFSEQQKKFTKEFISSLFPGLADSNVSRKILFSIVLECCPEIRASTWKIKRDLVRIPGRLLKWFYDYWQIICAKSDVIREKLIAKGAWTSVQNPQLNQHQEVNQWQRIQLPPIQSLMTSRENEELSQWFQDLILIP